MMAGHLPLQVLLLTFAGWVNREQQLTIEYLIVEHYHRERPHQGLGNGAIERAGRRTASPKKVVCEERLGGLLRLYRHAA